MSLPAFSVLLLLGVGCASATPVAPAPEPAASTSWPAYVMSSGDVMLRVPDGWDVRQFDNGGGSVVRVGSLSSEETVTVSVGLSRTEGGNVVTYEDWLADRDIPASATTVTLGRLSLQSREVVTEGDQTEIVYTGVLNTQPAEYVSVRFPAQASAELMGIVDSVQFSPTDDERQDAKVIP